MKLSPPLPPTVFHSIVSWPGLLWSTGWEGLATTGPQESTGLFNILGDGDLKKKKSYFLPEQVFSSEDHDASRV